VTTPYKKWYYANLERARKYGREYQAKKRAENPEKHRKINSAQWKKRTNENRSIIAEHKRTHPCVDCGESDLCCLDYHHLDPSNKLFRIGIAAYRKKPGEILAELDKCIALCANCHRKRHNKEKWIFSTRISKESAEQIPTANLCFDWSGEEPPKT
jgi:hypothetical protein